MEADKLTVNCKTGEVKREKFDYISQPFVPEKPGVNLDKLKQILLDKSIITNESEVE